ELQLRAARPVRGTLRLHLVAVPAGAHRRVRPRPLARAAQAASPAPPPMVSRASWGADRVPPRADPSYGRVQVGFVHHTVNANDYGPQDSAAIVLAIAKYHRDTNGWNDIGYNFLVDRFGQVFEGRAGGIDQPVIGAQAQGYNTNSTGVAVIGTFTGTPLPDAALEAVAHVLGWKLSVHGVPVDGEVVLESLGGDLNRYPKGRMVTFQRISGHRDGDATSCPGDVAYGQLADIRARAARYAFAPPVGLAAQVSVRADEAKVVYGRAARFSGVVLRADGSPGAGEPVVVQKRGRTRWVTMARTTADGSGAWSASVVWRATGDVRVQAAGTTSPAARVTCLPVVDVRRAARRVRAGGAVRLRGAVHPIVPVAVLVERQGRDGRWRRSTAVRARVRGRRYAAAVRLRKPGLYRLTPKAGTPAANGAATPQYVRAVRGGRARPTRRRSASGGVSARS
ncbi:MAG TPA: peptidoglycan recognition protein, partial [Solirubrobacteraceae bacterium]|nr:peptidoglycan recognition protein [Solirubrobacteraceae bacterium]